MPTPASVLLLALAAVGPAAASRLGASSKARITGSFLRAGMRPEIVARSLAKVEDEWKSQFRLFVECNSTASTSFEAKKCEAAPKAFEHACGTIVSAVVQASNGDHTVVREYMDDICNEPELKGWRAGRCKLLATSVLTGMTADNYDNREHLNSVPLCQSFWARFSTEEQDLLRKESAEREAEEKRLEQEREEEAKRAAEMAAEEDKRRREEEAAEAAEAAEAKKHAEEEEEQARKRQEAEAEASRPAVQPGTQAEEELKRQADLAAAPPQEKHEVASNTSVETEAPANATTAQNKVVANTSVDNKEAVNATTQAAAATETSSNVSVPNTSAEMVVLANATGNASAQNVSNATQKKA